MLTMRCAGAPRSSGSSAFVTAMMPNTLVIEHRAHLIEGHGAQATGVQLLLEPVRRSPRVHDARVIDQHVDPPELVADALGRRVDGGLIGDVEPEDSWIALDARRGPPPMLEVARSDEHDAAVRRQILGDLKTDSPVGSGDQDNWFVLHDKSPLDRAGG
jgi:hypothetical protein